MLCQDGQSIKTAQQMAISWRHYLRALQGIVYNFFDEEPTESAGDRLRRYQSCSLSECSDPSHWQEIHHGANPDLSDEDFAADYVIATESILRRAREAYQEAEINSDYERMCHFENIIDTVTAL